MPAFTDDEDETDALTVDTDGYKVMFLAFPFEEYGTAGQKATLMSNALNWFGTCVTSEKEANTACAKSNTNKGVKNASKNTAKDGTKKDKANKGVKKNQ